ncbi:DUF2202 domain-containing protein [Oligoflexia bacterium]|nr:DUF2202 domain-containing protein [Oligoflexia bacterium]
MKRLLYITSGVLFLTVLLVSVPAAHAGNGMGPIMKKDGSGGGNATCAGDGIGQNSGQSHAGNKQGFGKSKRSQRQAGRARQAQRRQKQQLNPGAACDITADTLSGSEVNAVLFMVEEEKLAGDVYEVLHGLWNAQVFSNISTSERRHEAALRAVLASKVPELESYGTGLPGTFVNPDLQNLYNNLVIQGGTDLLAAYEVGALVEEVDIADLKSYIAETSAADLTCVYQNLLRGSENHLRAFVKQLASAGIAYEPQVLSPDALAAILEDATSSKRQRRGKRTRNRNAKKGKGGQNSQ